MTSNSEVAQLLLRLRGGTDASSGKGQAYQAQTTASSYLEPTSSPQSADWDDHGDVVVRGVSCAADSARKLALDFILNEGADQGRSCDPTEKRRTTHKRTLLPAVKPDLTSPAGAASTSASAPQHPVAAPRAVSSHKRARCHETRGKTNGKRAKLHRTADKDSDAAAGAREVDSTQPRNRSPAAAAFLSSSSLSFSAPWCALLSVESHNIHQRQQDQPRSWSPTVMRSQQHNFSELSQKSGCGRHASAGPTHNSGAIQPYPMTSTEPGAYPTPATTMPTMMAPPLQAGFTGLAARSTWEQAPPSPAANVELLKMEDMLQRRLQHIHQQRELLLRMIQGQTTDGGLVPSVDNRTRAPSRTATRTDGRVAIPRHYSAQSTVPIAL